MPKAQGAEARGFSPLCVCLGCSAARSAKASHASLSGADFMRKRIYDSPSTHGIAGTFGSRHPGVEGEDVEDLRSLS